MRNLCRVALLVVASAAAVAHADDRPLALLAETQGLGRGSQGGTVVGIVVQVAPEDRDRAGDRVRVGLSLLDGERVIDRHAAVIQLEPDGSAMLFREWPPGGYELRVQVAALETPVSGLWIGNVVVEEMTAPFEAPEGAAPDAVALELTPPAKDGVRFLPPPEIGGIGAVLLEVSAPDATSSVEFFQDDSSMGRRNRPPWTMSVPLGDIVRRITVRAVARDAKGNFLGEDAVVLNSPTGQIGIEILLAPETSVRAGKRRITVAVTGGRDVQQVTLSLDDRTIARWAECPCAVDVPVADLERATILAADAVDARGARGDAVLTLAGGAGFVGSVRVELVELPIVVFDANKVPVLGLGRDDFAVSEDDRPVTIEGFGTTADLPLSLALAVDTSGSMVDAFAGVREAVAGFTSSLLQPGDQATLVRFSWDAEVLEDWTTEGDRIVARLKGIEPDGGTSLHDAVVRSLEQFRGRRGRQALVLLTDGEDTTSRTGWEVAERFAHTMRVPIFPIGLGLGKLDFSSRKVLNRMAEETGGEAFYPKDVGELGGVYERIAELLRSQYLLWYRSDSEQEPEKFRSIRVEVDRPELEVQTIRGYYPGK